jgi:hypothetical protein
VSFRGPKKAEPAQEIEVFSALYNPRHLSAHVEGPPKLIWPSVRHRTQMSEFDSPIIPELDLISARHAHNKSASDRDLLLGCGVFWEVAKRSKLIFIFDPQLSASLMRRLREALTPETARSLESLLLIGGTLEADKCKVLLSDIEKAFAKVQRVPKIFYLSGMKSSEAPFPHDRFAVTDGEFWHFGGTTGGIDRCLTAVSRGWKAKDVGVQTFMDAAWSTLSNNQKVNT